MQVGAVQALADEDWIFPSYRESAIGLLRGMPPRRCSRGGAAIRRAGGPREYRLASIAVPIATHIPHAVGLTWGKAPGESASAIAFFGDGATSEGRFTRVPTSLP